MTAATRIAWCAALALLATASMAVSGEIVVVDACAPPGQARAPADSPAAALKQCTALIESRRYAGADLAALHVQRGGALYGRGLVRLKSGETAAGNADIAQAKKLAPGVAENALIYGVGP